MHQLTARETEVLAAENRHNLGHHSTYIQLRAKSSASELSFEDLCQRIEERLHLLPGFRRRLQKVPLNLDRPWWIEDPDFDLEYHIRHLAVPSSRTEDALHNLLGRLHERPLDRRRPLWELYLIERPDGPPGIFMKVHHVLIDPKTGLDVLAPLVADVDSVPEDPGYRPDRVPEDTDLLVHAGWSLARNPWRSAELWWNASQRVPGLDRLGLLEPFLPWRAHQRAMELPGSDHTAPRTSFNRTIGTHRRIALVSFAVDDFRRARRRHRRRDGNHVRFNDVVLAVISGALRHWLVLHDELPTKPLIALTPLLVSSDVSERSDREPLATALVPLATHRHEPEQRLRDIADAMADLSGDMEALRVDTIREVHAEAPAIASLASRLIVRTGAFTRLLPPFNVYIVTVPGPDTRPDVDGFEIAHHYAMTALVDGVGLSISVLSNGQTVDFSLVADRELFSDLEVLTDQLAAELAVLTGD